MDYKRYGAVFLAFFVLLINLFTYASLSIVLGMVAEDPSIDKLRRNLMLAFILLPMISIGVTYYLCSINYTKVAYAPALLMNGWVLMKIFGRGLITV
jgi:hypothetical protein